MKTLRSSLRAAAAPGSSPQDLDRHAERPQARGERLRPGPDTSAGVRSPSRGTTPMSATSANGRAARLDRCGHRALERGARRVEVGVDLPGPQPAGRVAGDLEGAATPRSG